MVHICSSLSTKFEAVLLLLALSLAITSLKTVHALTLMHNHCYTENNYTLSSPFQINLNKLLHRWRYSERKIAGFYNETEGQDPDRIYGLFLCRGDVEPDICQKCIDEASAMVLQKCPGNKGAIMWYDKCLLRYSNRYFFSIMEDAPFAALYDQENVTNPDWFDETVEATFLYLSDFAVNSSPIKFYATRNVTKSDFLTLHVQCTPDLSKNNCTRCFSSALNKLLSFSSAKRGGRVFQPSCSIGYDLYLLGGDPRDQALPPASSSRNNETVGTRSGSKRRRNTWIIISSIVAGSFLVAFLGIFAFVKRKDGNMEHSQGIQLHDLSENSADGFSTENITSENPVNSREFPLLKLDIVSKATNHFSAENKLGKGGFGPVYKGVLADGREIAVKRLSRTSGQGLHELKTEVSLIARLQHRNLVRLLGCCLEKDEKLLIYEYMPNKSLDVFLFDSTLAASLDWKTRQSIIYGVARGLLYLHEDSRLRIIHRDLKASNILLDQNMVPKISDFGMAKIFGGNQDEANTNRVVGTYGYMSPEYAMEGLFSVKSDVFSFGVLLLEIVSGKKNTNRSKEGESLLTHAWKLWCKGQAVELTDPLIRESCDLEQALKCVHVALLCVQEDAADRPTMSLVVHMLVGETTSIPQPTQPAFSVKRLVKQLDQPHTGTDDCTVNQVTLSNVSPR